MLLLLARSIRYESLGELNRLLYASRASCGDYNNVSGSLKILGTLFGGVPAPDDTSLYSI